jgi:cysteine desulfurase family protein (TIGR01976 family)
MRLDVEEVRRQFPALASGAVHFENPGGTQVARQVVERMTAYLLHANSNSGGGFELSRKSDAIVDESRQAMADFLNAGSPDEIVFGANMTTLTFHVSRALAKTLRPGDEIVVTRLDHDANIMPWVLAAEDRGAIVRWADIHPEDCTLDREHLSAQINERTKIVACGYASNAMGTINDVAAIARLAHQAGALCYVDAVQYVPHGVTDVRAIDCDFLVCSAYKFFGPHVGVLYGKHALLESLPAYKVRPASDKPPYKFQTGTPNYEGIAGTLGAIEFFEWLGRRHGSRASSRRELLTDAMTAVAEHERQLAARLIGGLQSISGIRIWGITDMANLQSRVPTVSVTWNGWDPRALAERLSADNFYLWDGHHYACAIMERLGLSAQGGTLRIGLAHYNTAEEVDRFLETLRKI